MLSDRIALRDKLLRAYRTAFRGEAPQIPECTLDRQISDLTRALCTGVALGPAPRHPGRLDGPLRRLF